MIGNGIANLVRLALYEPYRGEEREARIRAAVAKEYDARCLATTRPYPGITELLAGLRSRGIPLAVCSNKPDAFTARIVNALFPAGTFAELRGERPGVPKKPDPASALDIAAKLGIPPAHCVFVGDSGVDIATGKAAGMATLGVVWGYRDRMELSEADGLAETPEAMPALLGWIGSGNIAP